MSFLRLALLVILIFAFLALVLLIMGQPLFCKCGTLVFWIPDTGSSHTSQHIFDPYSFSHFQHGLIFFLALLLLKVPAHLRIWTALLLEVGWEIVENTPLVIDRYRTATIALDYMGDSVLNSAADLFCCLSGFLIASKIRWQYILLLFAGIEIIMVIILRDSLLLNVQMLLLPLDSVKEWQAAR